MINRILEHIREKRTALKPKYKNFTLKTNTAPGQIDPMRSDNCIDMETDKNGNFNVFIVDRKGNVLFDKYGLTKRGRKAVRKSE